MRIRSLATPSTPSWLTKADLSLRHRNGKLPNNESVDGPCDAGGEGRELTRTRVFTFAGSASRRSTMPWTTRPSTSASSRRTARRSLRTPGVSSSYQPSYRNSRSLCFRTDIIRVLKEIVAEKNDDELFQNFL